MLYTPPERLAVPLVSETMDVPPENWPPETATSELAWPISRADVPPVNVPPVMVASPPPARTAVVPPVNVPPVMVADAVPAPRLTAP